MGKQIIYLSEAVDQVEMVKKGSLKSLKCPCCGQRCQVYRQKLYSTMAKFLVILVKAWEEKKDWVNVRDDPRFKGVTRNGNYAYLKHWNLVIQRPNGSDSNIRTSGMWMPSQSGIDFVYKRLSVPSHVYIFDNRVQRWEDKQFTIEDALTSKFNYAELISGKDM